ncbi:hypothetical protein HPP92_024918 [Vanilla planifolia]|uniref:Late embryogenesis abundant protein Lea5 n=1 Tax=Vanilla planifolia TaxID=51239 RepID=A0A835PJ34_VANPL|nr:hypothetical protein HPP92_025201 [Vanilla planifolia]KAG0453614.1 hypothetical protein HPP92_024918 [Vanilla planifolia]
MARFLRNGKPLIAFLSDGIGKPAVCRRGFSSAAEATGRNLEEKSVVMNVSKETATLTSDSPAVAWVPDPVTGYYRPANHLNEIDPAELRRILLKH